MRPKSEIYTPKREDEHPHPFHNDKKYYFMILKDNIIIKLQELIIEVQSSIIGFLIILRELENSLKVGTNVTERKNGVLSG